MFSQNDSAAVRHDDGIVTVWASVSAFVVVRPPSQASQLPVCAGTFWEARASTPAVAVHGLSDPVSNPGLASSCFAVQPPPEEAIVQEKPADPDAPVVSFAVT